jgi:hypothetical protein
MSTGSYATSPDVSDTEMVDRVKPPSQSPLHHVSELPNPSVAPQPPTVLQVGAHLSPMLGKRVWKYPD